MQDFQKTWHAERSHHLIVAPEVCRRAQDSRVAEAHHGVELRDIHHFTVTRNNDVEAIAGTVLMDMRGITYLVQVILHGCTR